MDILISDGSIFVNDEGIPYIGPYYIDNFNIAYIYNPNIKVQKRLINKRVYQTEFIRDRIKEKGGYVTPKPYIPNPKELIIINGKFSRFFCQKRINPDYTILEIDSLQFDNIDEGFSKISPSLILYNKVKLDWMIEGDDQFIKNFNTSQIKTAERTFKGLSNFLKDPLQFYKKSL